MEIFVGKTEVKSTAVFQPKMLYVELREWLIEFDYASPTDYQFPEKFFWEKRTQDKGTETWIWWRPTKTVQGSQHWRRVINVDFHAVGMQNVEIMYKGKKIKAQKGKFELLLNAKLEFDIGGKVRSHPITGPFFELFWKRIYRQEIEQWRKEVLADLKTIADIGRRFYDLGAFAVPKRGFMPAKGYEEQEF